MTSHPNRSQQEIRPLTHMRIAGTIYQDAWRQFDVFRQMRGKNSSPDWPEWCYCPLAAAYAIVSGGGDNRVPLDSVGHIAALGALAAWRVTQTIYRFDPSLAGALADTPIDRLPADVIFRLPEWCVYIETYNATWCGQPIAGFFAHLEHDAVTGRPELRLLIDHDDAEGRPDILGVPIHIGQPTLDEAMVSMINESRRQMIDHGKTLMASSMPPDLSEIMTLEVRPLIGMLLYLCSEQPDLDDFVPVHPEPKRTKKGWKIFPPDRPTMVTVGQRIGDELRRAYLADQIGTGGDRKGPRPHIRRAHWHTYLTGTGRVQRVLKWISPIVVNVDASHKLPVTVKAITP